MAGDHAEMRVGRERHHQRLCRLVEHAGKGRHVRRAIGVTVMASPTLGVSMAARSHGLSVRPKPPVSAGSKRCVKVAAATVGEGGSAFSASCGSLRPSGGPAPPAATARRRRVSRRHRRAWPGRARTGGVAGSMLARANGDCGTGGGSSPLSTAPIHSPRFSNSVLFCRQRDGDRCIGLFRPCYRHRHRVARDGGDAHRLRLGGSVHAGQNKGP